MWNKKRKDIDRHENVLWAQSEQIKALFDTLYQQRHEINGLQNKVFETMADIAKLKADFEDAMTRVAADTTAQINAAIIKAQADFQTAQQAALDGLDAEINAIAQPVVTEPSVAEVAAAVVTEDTGV